MIEVWFVDLKKEMVDAWGKTFIHEHVNIKRDSIFNAPVEAIVSPANSFGFMGGGPDLYIKRFFKKDIEAEIQRIIKEEYNGELLVGKAIFLKTEDEKIKYLISAPTMRYPGSKISAHNVYLSTKAALQLAKEKYIQSIAFAGMGTGVGGVSPEDAARAMHKAYKEVL